jgi:hypothetical protein
MLHTSRPLLAPEPIAALIDGAVYATQAHSGDIVNVELVVESATDSDTPLGDSIAGTSSTPLDPSGRRAGDDADDEDEDEALPVSVPTLGGQS